MPFKLHSRPYSTGAATAVGTARKSLTVMLSLVIFPKPFHVNYAAGVYACKSFDPTGTA